MGWGPVVRLLLDLGVDVNAQGGRLGNALQVAAHTGTVYDPNCDESVVRMLLDAGSDVNAKGRELGSALQAAGTIWPGEGGAIVSGSRCGGECPGREIW
jgi:hypothetical protein